MLVRQNIFYMSVYCPYQSKPGTLSIPLVESVTLNNEGV